MNHRNYWKQKNLMISLNFFDSVKAVQKQIVKILKRKGTKSYGSINDGILRYILRRM